ncbi:hypothetical protein GGF43_000857, partial [Coemansia sp. RSA 2618]
TAGRASSGGSKRPRESGGSAEGGYRADESSPSRSVADSAELGAVGVLPAGFPQPPAGYKRLFGIWVRKWQ